jgi:hypothetical protein
MKLVVCESCRRFELTSWQRLKEDIRSALFRPNTVADYVRSSSMMISALTGTRQLTALEMHRERWIQTGDEAELIRMLRHEK